MGQSKHFHLPAAGDLDAQMTLGGGLKAIKGFFHSVRPSTGRLLLNLNVSTAAFYQDGPLTTLVGLFDNHYRFLSPPQRAIQLEKFLRRLRVRTEYLKGKRGQVAIKVKTIFRIGKVQGAAARADGIRFRLDQGDGNSKQVTVQQYFAERHNIKLRTPEQIVVDVGTDQNAVYIPAELCTVVPGQVARQKLDPRQTSNMIKIACKKPPENAQQIVQNGLPLMGISGPQSTGLVRRKSPGITIVFSFYIN